MCNARCAAPIASPWDGPSSSRRTDGEWQMAAHIPADGSRNSRLERSAGEQRLARLRSVASPDLAFADGDATRVAKQVRQFVEWLDDGRPQFSEDLEGDDKFAELIEIARHYQDCTDFFVCEVGVNASTVWRWATGRSRPSRYVGKRLSEEVKNKLADVLWRLACDRRLVEG